MDNRSISQYHIVFIPKYRKKVLYGKIKDDVRDIINTLCQYKNVDIIAGAVCEDHVHLSVAIPSKLSVSNFMGYLKGKSSCDTALLGETVMYAIWRAKIKPPHEVVVANFLLRTIVTMF